MVHRPSYPYLVSFEKINLFLVLVLSGSLTISISNFVQWIQSSMPILSYPQPVDPKKKKLFFHSIRFDPILMPYTEKKIIFPFDSIRSYPIPNPWIQKKKNYFSYPSIRILCPSRIRKKKKNILRCPILSYPILSYPIWSG